MKKIIFLLSMGFATTSFSQTEISGKYDHIGKFYNGVALVKLNGMTGAINSEGKEIIKPVWDKLSAFGNDGIAYAFKNGQVGLITAEGKVLSEPVFDHIGMFHGNRAVVKKNGMEGIIDINGKILVEPKYDKLKVEENGLVKVFQNGQESLLKIDPPAITN
jgi:hypothetical protein